MNYDKFCRAELLERVDLTDDLAIFRFRPDRQLSFQAGQYATIAIEDGGKLIQRAYSIVSSPHEPTLEFVVELVHSGELTPHLWETRVGDEVLIRGKIVGRFTLHDSGDYHRHLMLATVTGIAPFVSMVRAHKYCLDRGEKRADEFAIIHGASYAHEFGPYKDELTELSRAGWLTYIPTVSRPLENADWTGETGRVEDLIRKYSDGLGFGYTNAVGYACGHPQMIENAKSTLGRARFSKDQVREEKYFIV